MSKTFVVGDIHGAYRALEQCLERSGFDHENDCLICLGDVCDGWPDTRECIDKLLTLKNLVYVLGNHDLWSLEWMLCGFAEDVWIRQGGTATVRSYQQGVPEDHINFLEKAVPYYLLNNRLFVHAGIDPRLPLERQRLDVFLWDRALGETVLERYVSTPDGKLSSFDEIYIGHTPVPYAEPVHACGVWMMDTGAGWSGVLSMMNIDTKELFKSDPVPSLYPGVEGRKRG